MNEQQEQRIECETGKLLCRVNHQGMWLWCQKHKRAELLLWNQIEALKDHYTAQRMEVTYLDHTHVS